MKKSSLHIILAKDLGYNEDVKDKFHREGKRVLKMLAKEMKLEKQDYSIRSNKGGIAVSGEVILHHKLFYVQIYQSSFSYGNVLYRTCEGQRDFTGGRNNYFPCEELVHIENFHAAIEGIL